ncbi:reticulon-like protein B11-like [Trifolium medium]|uniref:Reticulon-like protein n=1 Tax=Trifolium medium TaxID=97028 RepID=A0A392NDG6_9FABA|nr:reticulon-like protein B11-like [Trifolium medium]
MVEPNRISVHHVLGAGLVADVLLWKNWRGGVAVLSSATTLWYLFECAGYNFLSFVANVILLLVVILFLWAKAANLLNRNSCSEVKMISEYRGSVECSKNYDINDF